MWASTASFSTSTSYLHALILAYRRDPRCEPNAIYS